MTVHDEVSFAGLLATMFEVFQAELKPAVSAIYWDALVEYPWPTVQAALVGAAIDARHFHRVPRPGDLRIRCGAPTPEILWAQLDRALGDGYFAPPPETAPIVRRLIRMLGGWKHITEHMDHDTLYRRVMLLAPRILEDETGAGQAARAEPLIPQRNEPKRMTFAAAVLARVQR
jgi:hypothetical protein